MKAWKLFKNRKDWCQGSWARDKEGDTVHTSDPTAVTFCVVGAMRKVYKEGTARFDRVEQKLRSYVVYNTRFEGSAVWNDDVNQRWGKVKAVLKKLDI